MCMLDAGRRSQACIGGNLTAACYEAPAVFKRIYLIDMVGRVQLVVPPPFSCCKLCHRCE
jgi:hypothetical protein